MPVKPYFNPEINLGHIVQLFGGLLVLVGLYYTLDKRISLLEVNVSANTVQVQSLTKQAVETSIAQARLITLLETQLKHTYEK